MSLHLRFATSDDVALLHQITQESFAEYQGRLDPPSAADRETPEDVAAAVREGHAVLAYLDDTPAGCVRYRSEDGGVYVARLAVLPAMRRNGIGSALLEFVEARALAAGAGRLRLRVRLALPENVKLYVARGYRAVAVHPRSRTEAALTMVKDLGSASGDPPWSLVAPLLPDLQHLEPSLDALLLFGSYAQGSQGPFSDLDLGIVTRESPTQPDRLRLLPRPEGFLAVSIHARTLETILREASAPYSWPEIRDIYAGAKVIWGQPSVLEHIQAEVARLSPSADRLWGSAQHDLLSLVEALGKAKNAAARLDGAALLAATGRVAEASARLLRPLNPPWSTLHEARLAAIFASWNTVPAGAADDVALCLGHAAGSVNLAPALLAALRLTLGTIEILQPHADRLPLEPELRSMLLAGRLDLLARQEYGIGGLVAGASAG